MPTAKTSGNLELSCCFTNTFGIFWTRADEHCLASERGREARKEGPELIARGLKPELGRIRHHQWGCPAIYQELPELGDRLETQRALSIAQLHGNPNGVCFARNVEHPKLTLSQVV